MTTYNKYTPDFKCSSDGNGKGLVNASVGLLNYDEVVYAGGYYAKENNNYYLCNYRHFWTISPAGFTGSAYIWNVRSSGDMNKNYAADTNTLRPVINLNIKTQISD